VTIDGSEGRSKCVWLEIRDTTGSLLKKSDSATFDGRSTVMAGIIRAGFPETVSLVAVGTADERCTEPAVERSEPFPVTFEAERVVNVFLRLKALDADADGTLAADDCNDSDGSVNPNQAELCSDNIDNDCNTLTDCEDARCANQTCGNGALCRQQRCSETLCGDGLDNDRDGTADCADSDCSGQSCLNQGRCESGACRGTQSEKGLCNDGVDNNNSDGADCADPTCQAELCSDNAACTVGERCQSKTCTGGMSKCMAATFVCATATGECQEPDGTCIVTRSAFGASCSDGKACTIADSCDGDGGCAGQAKACNTPPGPCFSTQGACQESLDGGCVYGVIAGACNDMNGCTVNDQCLADGGCAGAFSCTPNECQIATGQCVSNQCQFTPRTGPCDGGVCDQGLCRQVLPPSNFPVSVLPSNPPAFELSCNATLLVDAAPALTGDPGCTLTGDQPTAISVSQASGLPTLSVFVFSRFTIRNNATLRIVPTTNLPADRVPVIAVTGDVDISGTIDVSALPGANRSGFAENGVGSAGGFCGFIQGGSVMSNRSGGGAGGSFGATGGNGGTGADNGGTGALAAAENGTAALIPLRGGCPGSTGGGGNATGRAGGAIQIWAQRSLVVRGQILASGGQGFATPLSGPGGGPGAGGSGAGSGGAILLEGASVTLESNAVLAANGGSGAQGSGTNAPGSGGEYGRADTLPADGGQGGSACGGNGGSGGAKNAGAVNGETGGLLTSCSMPQIGGGGGGGGSVGRIRINSLTPCTVGSNVKVSPSSTSNVSSCAL
jgi:hypothetical protein